MPPFKSLLESAPVDKLKRAISLGQKREQPVDNPSFAHSTHHTLREGSREKGRQHYQQNPQQGAQRAPIPSASHLTVNEALLAPYDRDKLWTSHEALPEVPVGHSSAYPQLSSRSMHTTNSSQGMFVGARNIVIKDSTMINYEGRDQGVDPQKENRVMTLIRDKRTPGAEIDSTERYPLPRCHPQTRTTTRCAITDWLANIHRAANVYWMLGSAGVGKSAVAQTLAEEITALGHFGAAFFFSRPNHRDDPKSVIPTLVHQFTVRFPDYKHFVIERLDNDHTILEKDIPTQFRLLIAEPFDILQASYSVKYPLLVVIDGLDECRDKDAQGTFIRLISDSAKKNRTLAWLICSRPEWHLKRFLPKNDDTIQCICDELLVDGIEGRDDVYRFLCDKFADIRRRYSDEVDESWPPEQAVVKIADVSSGHFAFASTAINFIGGESEGSPTARLETCVAIVDKSRVQGVNPLETLDLLYTEIMAAIPADVLSDTMEILSLHDLLGDFLRNLVDYANTLCLRPDLLYSALRGLHSVADIPPRSMATQRRLHFYHASFFDFLHDPGRSGALHTEMLKAHGRVAAHIWRWMSVEDPESCTLRGESCHRDLSPIWEPEGTPAETIVRFLVFLSNTRWRVFARLNGYPEQNLLSVLSDFHFCHLKSDSINGAGFLEFLTWLEPQGSDLLRSAAGLGADDDVLNDSVLQDARRSHRLPYPRIQMFKLREGKLIDGYFYDKGWSDFRDGTVNTHGDTFLDELQDGQHISYLLGRGHRACLVHLKRRDDIYYLRLTNPSHPPPSPSQRSRRPLPLPPV